MGAQLPDQRARLSRRSAICRSRAADRAGRSAGDRCRARRAHRRRRHQRSTKSRGCSSGCSSRAARCGEARPRKAIERLLGDDELPRRCAARSSCGSAALRRRSRRSTRCLPAPADDDRVRGAFRYHGAATGRWSGEGFQPQNLKRPTVEDLDAAIAAVATGDTSM